MKDGTPREKSDFLRKVMPGGCIIAIRLLEASAKLVVGSRLHSTANTKGFVKRGKLSHPLYIPSIDLYHGL
jgi:hypothetical protein